MFLRQSLRLLGHLHFLRFGVRDRIIRRLHNPDTSLPEEFTVPFFGAVYSGNFDTFLDWCVYYYGAYAREELRLISDFLRPFEAPVFLDIGANVGHHTLFAALNSKLVLAFEPFQSVYNKLEQKIAENDLSNIQLFKFALGEEDNFANYVKPEGHNTGTGSFLESSDVGQTLTLPIRRGDDILSAHDITNVHFIKIDTQGYEPFVLRGLQGTLETSRPLVFFEWTQSQRMLVEQYAVTLFPENYRFYEFIPETVVLDFFRKLTYRLKPLSDKWVDGNLFAVPEEYVERLRVQSPSCVVLKRLHE